MVNLGQLWALLMVLTIFDTVAQTIVLVSQAIWVATSVFNGNWLNCLAWPGQCYNQLTFVSAINSKPDGPVNEAPYKPGGPVNATPMNLSVQ